MPHTIGNTTVYTMAEVAEVCGKSVQTIWNHSRNDILHTKEFSRVFVVERPELERYVEERYKLPKEIIDLKMPLKPSHVN